MSDPKTYTAAVIGLSQIAQGRAPLPAALPSVQPMPRSHVAAYAAHPRVRLAGVCDIMPAAVARFDATWRDVHPATRTYQDYREMLEREKPDIVSVVTPDDLHGDIVVHAANSGVKAIWCEKPLATTLADADRMIAAVEQHGVAMTVSHTRRWSAIFHRARELARDKTYGALRMVNSSLFYPRAMLFRNGTHAIDMLCFLADAKPEWVIAELEDGFEGFDAYRGDGGHEIDSEPAANAYIKFANGVRASSLMVKSNNLVSAFELVFDEAVARIASDGQISVSRIDGPPPTATRGAVGVTQSIGHADWQQEYELAVLSELVACLDTGAPPALSPPRAARMSLAILLGMLESHARGNAKVMLDV